MGLIARELEKREISTVTLNMFLDVAEKVVPPRTLYVNFPFGAAFGDPNNKNLQIKVIQEGLSLLENGNKPGEIKKFSYNWREDLD